MLIPFTGQAYKSKYTSLNGQRCVNFYPVVDKASGKSSIALFPTPGYSLFCDLTGSVVRGAFEKDGIGYAVADSTFYKVLSDGTKTTIGTLLSYSGTVQMVDNPTQILIIDGFTSYTYTIATGILTQNLTTAWSSNPVFVDYQDGMAFVIAQHADGNYRVYFCGVNDFTSWQVTDLVTPTYKSDQVRAVVSIKEQLYFFSDKTIETFFNNNGTIQRRPLTSLNYGIAAKYSAVRIDESVIFLTKDSYGQGFVARYENNQIGPVSTEAITYAINTYPKIDDAIAWSMEYQGHVFYVLTFPTANVTWVYDLTTQAWFEWASLSSSPNASAIPGRHTANCYMNLAGKHIIGDYESGKLYEIKDTPYTSNPSATAILVLQISKDGGHTWSSEKLRTKQIGQYLKRPLWIGLGSARDWMFRLKYEDTINTENGRSVIRTRETAHFASEDKYVSISSLRVEIDIEPVPFAIINAYANGSVSGVPDNNQDASK
jgi:hypothetical protein